MHIANGPDLAAAQVVEHLAQESARTILSAYLDHAAVLSGRRHHLLPFPKVVRKRLLDINILAGLTGPNRRQRMPVIGQGDDHRVDRFVVENPAEVAVRGYLFAPVLEGPGFAVEVRLVHVAQRDDPGAGDLPHPGNELMPAAADTADSRG